MELTSGEQAVKDWVSGAVEGIKGYAGGVKERAGKIFERPTDLTPGEQAAKGYFTDIIDRIKGLGSEIKGLGSGKTTAAETPAPEAPTGVPAALHNQIKSLTEVRDRLGKSPLDLIPDQEAVTKGLMSAGPAASMAAWSRAYERMVTERTSSSILGFRMATRNLNNNLGTDVDYMSIVRDVRAQGAPPEAPGDSGGALGSAVDYLVPRLGEPGGVRRALELMYLGLPSGGLRPPTRGPQFPGVPTVVPPPPAAPVVPGAPPLGQLPPSLRSLVPPGRTIY